MFKEISPRIIFKFIFLKVVAFYNGIRIPGHVQDDNDSWDDCAYRIFLNPHTDPERGKVNILYKQ